MVCNDSKSNICFFRFSIILIGEGFGFLDDIGKDIRIIIGFFFLNHSNQSFKPHSCIHMFLREVYQFAIGHAVKLHEYIIPNLDNLGMVGINQFFTLTVFSFAFGSKVNVYFRTWTTRARFSHFPKIILFIPVNNMAFVYEFLPYIIRLLIKRQAL